MAEMEEEAEETLRIARGWVAEAKHRCETLKKNRAAREDTGVATATATATAQSTENEAAEGRNKRQRRMSEEDWDVVEIGSREGRSVKQEKQ
jgi:hypothetical protein